MAKKRSTRKKPAAKKSTKTGQQKASKGSGLSPDDIATFKALLAATKESDIGPKAVQDRYPPDVFEEAEKICESFVQQALAAVEAGPRKRKEARKVSDQTLELIFESDRGCVLIAAAHMDETIKSIAEEILCSGIGEEVKAGKQLLYGFAAPLGTAWARELFLFAMGELTENVKDGIKELRDLRNRFAHRSEPAILTDDAVNKVLKYLEVTDRAAVDVMGKQIGTLLSVASSHKLAPFGLRFAPTATRMRFIFGVTLLMKHVRDKWERRAVSDANATITKLLSMVSKNTKGHDTVAPKKVKPQSTSARPAKS